GGAEASTGPPRQAEYAAGRRWGISTHSLLQRVAAIDLPVFVANAASDPMILPRYSHLLAGLLPDARVTIYPDSAHGFLFQHSSQFAADVNGFLRSRLTPLSAVHSEGEPSCLARSGTSTNWVRPVEPTDLQAKPSLRAPQVVL